MAQKRKDRQKDDCLKEIENSGNKEKTFYENIVQIGKKTDTPVADENGMKTRNSLTKAFQQMGFARAVSRKQNQTVAWQERVREYLTELCREQGIEIEVIGVKRDNLTLFIKQQSVNWNNKWWFWISGMRLLNSRMMILRKKHRNFADRCRKWRRKIMSWCFAGKETYRAD